MVQHYTRSVGKVLTLTLILTLTIALILIVTLSSPLPQYREACADLVEGATTSCSLPCRHALIGLISTVEGERLMECTCSDGPCTQEKARVEPCRAEVTWQTAPDSVVGCAAAAWICHASPACSKALDYYHANCQELFAGERCSSSCRNSVEILARQAAAAKLATCTCTGGEAWACTAIRKHTDTLCFGREEEEKEVKVVEVVGKEMGMEVGNEAEEVNRDRELWKGEVGLSARHLCVLVITVLGETVRTFVENLKL